MCQLRGKREKVFTLALSLISAHMFAERQWKHPSSLKGHMTVYTKSHDNVCVYVSRGGDFNKDFKLYEKF